MADLEKGNKTILEEDEEEEEDDEEYEYEEVSEYDEETESEDEAVDKVITKQISLESNEDNSPSNTNELASDPHATPNPATPTTLQASTANGSGEKKSRKERNEESGENGEKRKHHKKHKKSRHIEKFEAFNTGKPTDSSREKSHRRKIHVRSKDPASIAKQLEKSLNGGSSSSRSRSGKGKPAPPPPKINTVCKICGKEPYVVERLVAEKSWWHKNCFRCKQCNKILTLDTYMSHEGVIYCKPHHRELFQPKVVKDDIIEVKAKPLGRRSKNEDAIERHREQERKMETIVRENEPIDLGDDVIRSSATERETKYNGLEDLDVGSKFKMFEKGGSEEAELMPRISTDRYGIMEKLKRLQEGEDLDDLLAEIDEEMPDDPEEEVDPEEYGMSEMEKKTHKAEMMFSDSAQDRRDKKAEQKRLELKELRESLMSGNKDNVLDQFEDLLNSSANKIKKTKVDVRSANAKKFREMFDKGEVPEGSLTNADKTIKEKNHELEQMRKTKRDQKEYFKKMEKGELEDPSKAAHEPKLLVGKFKDKSNGEEGGAPADMELASLSNRFSFFENYKDKEPGKPKKKQFRISPSRDGEEVEAEPNSEDIEERRRHLTERDIARRDCKAASILKKFKEMEEKVLNGEDDVGEKRPLKRFTPPRKLGSESESDYSDSDYSDSDSYTDSYSDSEYSDSDVDEDETLRAIRATQRAKALRAKFEEWEQSQDAKEQERQMKLTDENGSSLDTASHLKKRFEALQLREEAERNSQAQSPKFRPKRFK
ncbi:hypothetical protein TCAL_08369 [Tigriopus californicus]|uniref:LIM zinc-binding domain-containing protein n=1 Tax=Tigriopus californicus TaxID=6832 RepID=A0A553PCN8_TIGCA|nr:DNA ligase 1-like isoform X2 [Tigriopus californicus]TRY75443.1 hypothetical protein TCAL_08369 [Tigriopus californicus]|eukprot:TCALIF_08369-PA protein Name:"Similar to Xirp2 Xin actin-binding repeat-containing protein 2 (Mus musculus)" AED:0.02 eAED:0.02 QI:211/1/1/1/0.92/0.85/14/160/769